MTTLIGELLARCGSNTLADVGEKALLRDFILPLCRDKCGDYGLGNDVGTIPMPDGQDIVVTTDRVPTDLLAIRYGLMSPEQLGGYLVRVNVSDIAASGARPLGMVVTCAFEKQTPVSYVLRVLDGAYTDATSLGCPVIGGDTKSAVEQSLSATAFGSVENGKAIGRGPVAPGMKVYVSGLVGYAGAALRWFAKPEGARVSMVGPERSRQLDELLKVRLVRPVPRLDLAPLLAESDCVAAMDLTDGLIQSVREIGEYSNVGIVISADESDLVGEAVRDVADALSVSPREIISGIGLDAELVVVCSSNPDSSLFIELGEIVGDKRGVYFADGSPARTPGFEHFRLDAQDYV